MKYLRHLCLIIFFPFSLCAERLMSLNIGPTVQYTKYKQGCLPKQVGFMAGPNFDFRIKKPWRPAGYIGFVGLWDIPHICSDNGLIIDSNEYEVNGHLGFEFQPEAQNFSLIPFTGIDFVHLKHEVKDDIIKLRYNQVNVPIGLEFIHYWCEDFTWGLKAYYDIDAWTRLKVSTPCLCDTNDCSIELERSHRFQIKGLFEWHYRVEERVGIDITWMPLFTWQRFGKDKCCDESGDGSTELNIQQLTQWHLGSMITFGISF